VSGFLPSRVDGDAVTQGMSLDPGLGVRVRVCVACPLDSLLPALPGDIATVASLPQRTMSAPTGSGGWAQLRQQARTLETQVRKGCFFFPVGRRCCAPAILPFACAVAGI